MVRPPPSCLLHPAAAKSQPRPLSLSVCFTPPSTFVSAPPPAEHLHCDFTLHSSLTPFLPPRPAGFNTFHLLVCISPHVQPRLVVRPLLLTPASTLPARRHKTIPLRRSSSTLILHSHPQSQWPEQRPLTPIHRSGALCRASAASPRSATRCSARRRRHHVRKLHSITAQPAIARLAPSHVPYARAHPESPDGTRRAPRRSRHDIVLTAAHR